MTPWSSASPVRWSLRWGLLIVSGATPQAVVILAGIPFNATLFFLGRTELIGPLPIYGALLALLVYGSPPTLAAEAAVPSPVRRRRSKTGRPIGTSVASTLRRLLF
ncbi:MAG: hypothetical protein ACRDJL_09560 [Actinomycetota bacterium]